MEQIDRKETRRKARKAMTVATAFTGVTAAAIGFAPEATANSAPPMPFTIVVYTPKSVYWEQVCAYKSPPPGQWTCTPVERYSAFGVGTGFPGFGGNWRRGHTNVWEWNQAKTLRRLHSCNTNGAWSGFYSRGVVYLEAPGNPRHPLGLTNSAGC